MGTNFAIFNQYSKSFTAKLMLADEQIKKFYSELKNECLAYEGVCDDLSWRREGFRIGKKTLVRFKLRGKTLSVLFALDPAELAGTKYHISDASDIICNAATITKLAVKSERKLKYAKELIAVVMATKGAVKGEVPTVDYVAQLPSKTEEELLEMGLIKIVHPENLGVTKDFVVEEAVEEEVVEPVVEEVVEEEVEDEEEVEEIEIVKEVEVSEVDELVSDDQLEENVTYKKGKVDKSVRGVVNVKDLNACFKSGAVVTLEEIKKVVPGFNKKVTYVKVLAGGTLSKSLTVEANEFSDEAAKMILVTGGKVIKISK